jgi:serine/threonine protein kinase
LHFENCIVEKTLSQMKTLGQVQEVLDWKTRMTIALGTARGLAYLHHECRSAIIHCDIKPENILLTADFTPKVSDLGLAKLLGKDVSRVITMIRGTRGYLAPEWLTNCTLTSKVCKQVFFELPVLHWYSTFWIQQRINLIDKNGWASMLQLV